MKLLYLRWLYLSLFCRIGVVVLMLFSFWGISHWFFWQPAHQQITSLFIQQQVQQQRYVTALTTLKKYDPESVLTSQISELREVLSRREVTPRVLENIVRHSGGELVLWQPQRQGEALTLKLTWPQLQGAMAYLRTLAAQIEIPHLTLSYEKNRLSLQMMVQSDDEKL